jgi:pSer/pThr/pTyr-binding forkhead associated (FHA) protein
MRAQLIPLEAGETIVITKDLTLVGRKENCDLRLDHKSVSKMHCVIVKTDGLLLLRDLGSTNGTRVNGQRVRRAALLPNDQLTIATFKFKVQIGPDEEPPAPPHEYTQQLDAKEVAQLFDKHKKRPLDESSGEMPILPVQNPLPDVYPEDEHKGR